MKIKRIFFLALMITGVVVANAQGGGSRRTVEERVQAVHAKMDSAFKLEAEKQVKVDSVFANYYRQQNKIKGRIKKRR